MIELYFLFSCIVLMCITVYLNHSDQSDISENFTNSYLSSCPTDYKLIYDSNGDMICCNGDIIANKCIADKKCILNGKGTDDMPNCTEEILKLYMEKGQNVCPSSYSYYEDKANNIKGCTYGELNHTLSGPATSTQKGCKVYNNNDDSVKKVDSCQLIKEMNEFPCFGRNCTKSIKEMQHGAKPALIAVEFLDDNDIYRTSYTRTSYKRNMENSTTSIDFSKNIMVAEVAKAYFIDKTLGQSDIEN